MQQTKFREPLTPPPPTHTHTHTHTRARARAGMALTSVVFDFQSDQNRFNDPKGNKNIICTVVKCLEDLFSRQKYLHVHAKYKMSAAAAISGAFKVYP